MINTLKMLIRADLGNTRTYGVSECRELINGIEVHEDWWVINENTGDPILVENTLEEAEIYCGLCNLLDTEDFEELTPYLRELLPHWFEDDKVRVADAAQS